MSRLVPLGIDVQLKAPKKPIRISMASSQGLVPIHIATDPFRFEPFEVSAPGVTRAIWGAIIVAAGLAYFARRK